MNAVYNKECISTLIAFAFMTLLTHLYPMYFLFPGLTEFTIFGFPAHYFLTMVIGWLVLMPVYYVYINISEKIDDDIREMDEADAVTGAKPARGGAK